MPTYKTAKDIAEDALKTIGAFPASQSQADAGELRDALNWLEMVVNHEVGVRPLAGFTRIVEIPLKAGVGDYLISDYTDEDETQHVFSVHLVESTGDPDPLPLMFEGDSLSEDLTETGTPNRAVVTKDVKPYLKVFPTPVQSNEDAGQVLRLRIQVYHPPIDETGNAGVDIGVRPSWYLWLTKRLSYELGCGPVRKLGETELRRLENNAITLENALLAGDGLYNAGKPPVTEPYGGATITYASKEEVADSSFAGGKGYSSTYRRR